MITFNVVKEPFGWAIRLDERMTTPFRLRDLAIREADALAESIRRHGENAQVLIDEADNPRAGQTEIGAAQREAMALRPR